MQAIGYVRVSTAQQATDGVSLEAQRERIIAWCRANGYTLGEIHVDHGLSGARADNRPALQAALKQAAEAKATVVTYSLSRVARSTTDAIAISERLRQSGADLVSLSEHIDTTTAAGKMVFRMLAVLAAIRTRPHFRKDRQRHAAQAGPRRIYRRRPTVRLARRP